MPIKFYLERRLNKHGEAPIRMAWAFYGDRFQTTIGYSIPPEAWDAETSRVTPEAYNHKKTPTTTLNNFIAALERAANRMDDEARRNNTNLTKPLVKQIFDDVMSSGGEYPTQKEREWKRLLKQRSLNHHRYFEHFKGGKYKLIGFGKDSETLEDVVVYQALYGVQDIWVRPYKEFFSKVTLPDETEVERFKEITI